MLAWLVCLYRSDDSCIPNVDLVVPVSYTTTPSRLTRATEENLRLAMFLFERFSGALMAASNCSYPFAGAEVRELDLKRLITLGDKPLPIIWAAPMRNSVEEAEAIKTALACCSKKCRPKRILVVTGEMHSRSARIIWQKVFPDAQIFIRCTPYRCEYQEDHCVEVQRSGWVWLGANLARHVLLRIFGLRIRSLRHRASAP